MIVTTEALGRVKTAAGSFIFTRRMGESVFYGVSLDDIDYIERKWAYVHQPEYIEVVGGFYVTVFDETRSIPYFVDEFDYINSQLAIGEEMTYEDYQEMCELLNEEEY